MKNVIVIILLLFLMDGVFGADEIKVTEGDSLTLPTGLTETQSSGRIRWLYVPDGTIIAEIEKGNYSTNDDDERFKGNLELDKQTGSLTIKNNRIKNSGLYKLDINRGTTSKTFSVTVYAILPTPDIDSPQCAQTPAGSSSPICVFLCSVQTSDQTTLSWNRGNTEVSKKNSDICSSLSLRLEVNYEDKDIYSCMVNNPISNKTKHLDITQLCNPCEDPGLSPGAVAGIVVGVLLMFAAAAAGVIYYFLKIPKRQNQTMETVMEGESLILKPVTEINKGGQIQLIKTSGDKDTLIAQIKGGTEVIILDGRFKDRLEVDKRTGSFTITDTRTEDSGLYKILIRRGIRTLYEEFYISVIVKPVSVNEGENVTLNTDVTEVQGDDLIEWRFGDKGSLIAEIRGGRVFIYDTGLDEKFLDRLKLDEKTGSLTIMNTRNADTGLYELKISQDSKIKHKMFNVSVGVKTVSVFEGDPVTLETDAEIQRDDIIEWRFGIEGPLLAQIRGGIISKYDDVADGRFRDRLELDKKTGDLTITNTEIKHAGDYLLQITSIRGVSCKTFRVVVRKRTISVKQGKNVILNPETEIQKDDLIQWRFGDKDTLIAEIRGGTGETHDDDVRFRGRLRLDEKTGSLIITDITAEQSGDYKLKIISSSRGTTNKRFLVSVSDVCTSESVRVLVGEDVTLRSDTYKVKDDVNWLFNGEILAIGKNGHINKTTYCDERFNGRLKLDHQTGTLTIKNTITSDNGVYCLKLLSRGIERKFVVIVNADSAGNRVNDLAVEMPPVNEEDRDVGNEEEGMSLLVMR